MVENKEKQGPERTTNSHEKAEVGESVNVLVQVCDAVLNFLVVWVHLLEVGLVELGDSWAWNKRQQQQQHQHQRQNGELIPQQILCNNRG